MGISFSSVQLANLIDAREFCADRQNLLGHRLGRMTTHYSAAELSQLIKAANSVCERSGNRPELVVFDALLSIRLTQNSRKGFLIEAWKRTKPLKRMVARGGPIREANQDSAAARRVRIGQSRFESIEPVS